MEGEIRERDGRMKEERERQRESATGRETGID